MKGKNQLPMLRYLDTIAHHGFGASQHLITEQGFHPNVVRAKAWKADRRGYTEYGVASYVCWLTDKGKAFLALEEIGADDE